MALYRIKKWADHFENNRTKELKRMAWVPMPNKMDGSGYTRLIDHEHGAAHFGAWCAIVEIASRCDPRGTLSREGAMSPHDLARISRLPAGLFESVIPRLLEIQWLEVVTDIPQEGAETSQNDAALRVRAGGNGTERNGTEMNEPSVEDDPRILPASARLLKETGIGSEVPRTSYRDVDALIEIGGFEKAKAAILESVSKGIGGKGALGYALKILAGDAAKHELRNGDRSRPKEKLGKSHS